MMTTPQQVQEEYIICPNCQEEAFVQVRPGFNIVQCPCCPYFCIVYVDEEGGCWTREVGVLQDR